MTFTYQTQIFADCRENSQLLPGPAYLLGFWPLVYHAHEGNNHYGKAG